MVLKTWPYTLTFPSVPNRKFFAVLPFRTWRGGKGVGTLVFQCGTVSCSYTRNFDFSIHAMLILKNVQM